MSYRRETNIFHPGRRPDATQFSSEARDKGSAWAPPRAFSAVIRQSLRQSSMYNIFRFSLILAVFCYSSFAWADTVEFFELDDAISLRLEAPISSLKKQRGNKVDWLESKLYYTTEDGSEAALNVKIEARGHFRRMRINCSFPPYWINFRKSETKGTPFAGLDKVKIVSHCKGQGRSSYEPYMYMEYLVYKTYNLLTDLSFRVRLANINYHNTDKDRDEGEFAAFFIEHVNTLEDRLSSKQVKDQFVLPSRYNHRDLCIAEMFQFFLGNTDFSFFASEDECCHNAKVFAPSDTSNGLFPVPYDFDMAGLLSLPYAKPDPHFEIASVKHRMYRGIAVEHEILEETMKLYFDKKEEIYELWENFELLEDKYRAKALDFMDEFYKIFSSKQNSKMRYSAGLRPPDKLEKIIQEDIDKAKRRAEKR